MKTKSVIPSLETIIKDISKLNSENVLALKDFLSKHWKPRSTSEAIAMKHIQSIFLKAKNNINTQVAEKLNKLEYLDAEIVDSVTGLKVLRKQKRMSKAYNQTDELVTLEKELEVLKVKIEKAKENAGYSEVREEGYDYVSIT